MTTFVVNNPITVTYKLTKVDGTPATGTVVISVKDPNGNISTPAVSGPSGSLGNEYSATFMPTISGVWTVTGKSSGSLTSHAIDTAIYVASSFAP